MPCLSGNAPDRSEEGRSVEIRLECPDLLGTEVVGLGKFIATAIEISLQRDLF